MRMTFDAPNFDEVEISVFGKGYGECIVAHYGDGNWIIIDSFLSEDTKRPIALEYLRRIGVDARTQVKFVIASHWHRDHIRGITECIDECESAAFVYSHALNRDEFRSLIAVYKAKKLIDDVAVRELYDSLEIVLARKARGVSRTFALASPDRRIVSKTLTSGLLQELITLSPSDVRCLQSLIEIGSTLEDVKRDIICQPMKNENDLSIVTWLTLGSINVLLGADLEEPKPSDPDLGWNAIILSPGRPQNLQASAFKVGHHGSPNAEHPQIWSDLLANDRIAIVTAYNALNRARPRRADAERILNQTQTAFLTSVPKLSRKVKSSPAIDHLTSVIKRRRPIWSLGHVRLRGDANQNPTVWRVELDGAAGHLKDLINELDRWSD